MFVAVDGKEDDSARMVFESFTQAWAVLLPSASQECHHSVADLQAVADRHGGTSSPSIQTIQNLGAAVLAMLQSSISSWSANELLDKVVAVTYAS